MSTLKGLDKKTKALYIFLIIITFGLFCIYINCKINKAKNRNFDIEDNQSATPFKVSKKIDIDVDKLISLLGGEQNIELITSSLSSIKVLVKDKKKVNAEEIKKNGAKGVMVSGLNVSVIFGDNSIEIARVMNEKIEMKVNK